MASSLDHQAFGKTRAEWLANLNTEFKPPREFRRTSIICTIGMSASIRADH
jgi:pyruvate kinase